uniref:Uncharacterized protein n=1 Tax=viral metagenome TaxID=1070528 RepID=A0A6C0BXI2_9ZZZZ
MNLYNYILLLSLSLFFDTIGAHLYSKITILTTIILMINSLKADENQYNIINTNEDIEL